MQPAPTRTPINSGGPVSKEWWLWFQQLQNTGSTVEAASANYSALAAQVTAANTAVAALEAKIAALSGPTLETNGQANRSQTKLNLRQGSNVTLSDDGAGNVTIAAAANGAGLALSTNGTRNGSQAGLNLQQGANIALADNGQGTVTVQASFPATHGEPLMDGAGNLVTANGDAIEAIGVPN
jgi:hypothetical protein